MINREIDVLVAEKVMEWKLADRKAMGWSDGPDVWITGEDPNDENSNPTYQGFEPSTDIAAAWLVVEKMREDGWQVGIQSFFGNWKALLADEHDEVKHRAIGCSPAKAICLVALKAKEMEVDVWDFVSPSSFRPVGRSETGNPQQPDASTAKTTSEPAK